MEGEWRQITDKAMFRTSELLSVDGTAKAQKKNLYNRKPWLKCTAKCPHSHRFCSHEGSLPSRPPAVTVIAAVTTPQPSTSCETKHSLFFLCAALARLLGGLDALLIFLYLAAAHQHTQSPGIGLEWSLQVTSRGLSEEVDLDKVPFKCALERDD
jgi:hypothetical protein